MSKRQKPVARAVSPDILDIVSVVRRPPAKSKKSLKDEKLDEGPSESEDLSKTPGDAGEPEGECDSKAEADVDGIQKKRRGRPKKNPPASQPSAIIESSNGNPGAASVTGNRRKGRGGRQVRGRKTAGTEALLLEQPVEPDRSPSPIEPCLSPDVTGESIDVHAPILDSTATFDESEVNDNESSIAISPELVVQDELKATLDIGGNSDLSLPHNDIPNVTTINVNNESPQEDSAFLATNIFERKYSPGFIPGLDLEPGDDSSNKIDSDSNSINFGSVMTKTLFQMEKTKDKEMDFCVDMLDESDNKIRRSSRIKSLEESRGPRSRRREVVFSSTECLSASSSRSQSVVGDDDSNSNSSLSNEVQSSNSPTREDSSRSQLDTAPSSTSNNMNNSSLSFMNILNFSSTCPTNGSLKPLKVKSRWRYSLDAENLKLAELAGDSAAAAAVTNGESSAVDTSASSITKPVVILPPANLVKKPGFIIHDADDDELIDKLKKFDGIEDSIFFTERKISKESKYMICDCYLSKDDITRGEIGCNEDCLNRLLMVECGSRCPTGDRCTNRKFQRKEYCKLEVFKTEKKGHGLRTLNPVPAGGFVIEYVGEVLNPRGFTQRTKEYAKEKQEHFYFMALRSDTIIDATLKGNCSRFINHSCEPNCETQKWTVNGELRIGFFTLRDLDAGEEITFDYQFQRYGKKAQKCFCQSEKCRGWIGGEEEEYEEDDLENKEPDLADDYELEIREIKPREEKKPGRRKKKQIVSSEMNEFGDRFMEELESLERTGLKNQKQTLMLCRLMVRAEDWDARERILTILTNGDQPCRRLFLDYHGLRLIHGWMSTLPLPDSETSLITNDAYHLIFLKALGSLPIPNKTLLKDSQMLALVEKWSEIIQIKEEFKPEEPKDLEIVETVVTGEAAPSDSAQSEAEPAHTIEEMEVDQAKVEVKEEDINSVNIVDSSVDVVENVESAPPVPSSASPEEQSMELDTTIIEVKQEVPVAESKRFDFIDGAKQLLLDWSDLKEVFRIPKKERVEQMKEHEREADIGVASAPMELKESSYDRDGRSSKLSRKGERRFQTLDSYLPYNRSVRDYAKIYSNLSKEERRLIFARKVAEQEKETQKQRQMQDEMVVLHQERCRLLNLDASTTPIVDPSGSYYLDPKTITWKEIDPDDPTIPPELLLLVQAAMHPPMPDRIVPQAVIPPEEPAEASFPPWPEGFPPPPPLPPTKLPSGWEMVPDEDGRFYYFHLQSQRVTWIVPSDSSDASDLSSSSDSSDSEDESVAEDEPSEVENLLDASQVGSEEVEKISKAMERRERRKLTGLVQERIISPRSEDDKPLLSQKLIRARKLELMAEKRRGHNNEEIDEEPTEKVETQETVIEVQERPEQSPREGTPSETVIVSIPLSSSPAEKKRKVVNVELLDEHGGIDAQEVIKESEEDGLELVDAASGAESEALDVGTIPDDIDAPASEASSALSKSGLKHGEKKKSHKKSKSSGKKSVDKAEIARKLKEKKSSEEYFRNQIANVIVQNLNPYRKPDCKNGRITSTDHFKHLARKLTHMVTTKEVKHCKNAKTLVVNDSVRHKTKEFVKKYMGRFVGRDYEPSPQDN